MKAYHKRNQVFEDLELAAKCQKNDENDKTRLSNDFIPSFNY